MFTYANFDPFKSSYELFAFEWNKFRKLAYVSLVLSPIFSLVSLFNGISTLCRLFNAKAILLEEQ